jgi:hypothetical protein
MELGNGPIGLRGGEWPTFSQELRPRAEQAPPLRRPKAIRRGGSQRSHFRFEIGETASSKAVAKTTSNAGPKSPTRNYGAWGTRQQRGVRQKQNEMRGRKAPRTTTVRLGGAGRHQHPSR